MAAESAPPLSPRHAFSVCLQTLAGWLVYVPLALAIQLVMRFVYRVRIENKAELHRQFREYAERGVPIIICPNHLTMVDSVIIIYALASVPYYFLHYRLVSWNIPAMEHTKANLVFRIVTYLGKCLLIDRGGDQEHIDLILAKLRHVVQHGHLATIFPEGTRSRTGRIDPERVTYGIGKLVRDIPHCHVLCMYVRGRGQETYSNFPARGESFSVRMELFEPRSDASGLRQIRDISQQVMNRLVRMEEQYFAERNAALAGQ
ncbi:MAG: 1-acyl-sn-glycerol-3-phosphate acyltransferase [Oligoflexia bacterium]|nr:1-acyl-sn-glycerol-3-phosphate acyltransferase [Oligoflexia bacterium]